jgi:putative PIN family toxin of toxin-antitoxin system
VSRVVVDTNVLISFALNPRGGAGQVIEIILRRHELIGSAETIAEFYTVLFSDKLAKFLSFEAREQIAAFLMPFVALHHVNTAISACRDPKDDKFLELAVAATAEVIVTGDADLLALHPFRGIAILTPAHFLRREVGG